MNIKKIGILLVIIFVFISKINNIFGQYQPITTVPGVRELSQKNALLDEENRHLKQQIENMQRQFEQAVNQQVEIERQNLQRQFEQAVKNAEKNLQQEYEGYKAHLDKEFDNQMEQQVNRTSEKIINEYQKNLMQMQEELNRCHQALEQLQRERQSPFNLYGIGARLRESFI